MNFHDLSTDVQQELINAKADLILRHEPTRGHFAMYLMHAKFRADWIKYLDKMGYYNLSKFLTENPTRSPFFAFCPYGYDPVPCSFYGMDFSGKRRSYWTTASLRCPFLGSFFNLKSGV